MVEEMLVARGIELTYETVRCCPTKFGLAIARRIRSTAPGRGDKWHLDEVIVTINARKHWLWRAVDQHGAVLDVLVQSRRDKAAASQTARRFPAAGRMLGSRTDPLKALAGVYIFTCVILNSIKGSTMEHLVRVQNEYDRQTLAWLRQHVGDAAIAAAVRGWHGTGKPYLSVVCRLLGVTHPGGFGTRSASVATRIEVGEQHLAAIRQILAVRSPGVVTREVSNGEARDNSAPFFIATPP
jgi:hypothetical protein